MGEMVIYLYCGDILCGECGRARRLSLDAEGQRPADPDDESSYDSGDYPKGPFPAEQTERCGECGAEIGPES